MRLGVGFTLQPEARFLELCAPLLHEDVDYFEVAPETTWVADETGTFEPNGYHGQFVTLAERTRKPVVAHGVGYSLGSATRDAERDARWLAAIARDRARFGFAWYTDHLGVTRLDGCELMLPLPLPHTDEAAGAVRGALDALAKIVPDVGFENSAFQFFIDEPLDEPRWIETLLRGPRRHLLLDVHNLVTNAENAGFDARVR